MSLAFEKLINDAIENNCDFIRLENESDGFTFYIISGNNGYALDISNEEIREIYNFVNKTKKNKGKFNYSINGKTYTISVQYREDFGERVFNLKIYPKNSN